MKESKSSKDFYENEYHIQYRVFENNIRIYDYVMEKFNPSTLFEFGCNAGRHLAEFKTRGVKVVGIDINKRALEYGRKHFGHDTIKYGDEHSFNTIGNKKFDVIYTNSVLCHIPDIDDIITQFKRIGSNIIIFESPTKEGPHWYPRNYEDYGFKKIWNYYAPEPNADYIVYELCVE